MKNLLTFIFLIVSLSAFGQTIQVDTINFRPHNSIKTETTIKTDVFKDGELIKSKTKKKKTKYSVDNKKSNKENYDQAQQQSKTIDDCKPCWLRYYDNEGNLLQEGLSYSDCALGKRTEYYPSGKIKVIRYYKTNDTNDWNNFPCSVADGTWTYYTESGIIEKTELYKDGKQIQ